MYRDLNRKGLVNDGIACSIISGTHFLHRAQLSRFFLPNNSALANDPSIEIYWKVLQALPSDNAFSLQQFIQAWPWPQNNDMLELDKLLFRLLPFLSTTGHGHR